jgi:AcrR family transcriptional regulator
MGRPAVIRDEDILHAAREVFLARGLRATTPEVAKKAGISEASIFKHFKTKEALFRAAMQPELAFPEAIAGLPERAGQSSVAENLDKAGAAIIQMLRTWMPLSMLAFSSGTDPGKLHRSHPRLPTLRCVREYVKKEIENKRLHARVHPETFARAFVGGIADYVIAALIAPGDKPSMTPARYVTDFVNLLLRGAKAE